jgi:REP element-mobilizing transposase RayT
MPHTYASNFIHCIFSTKDRCPIIRDEKMPELFAFFGGIAKDEGLELIIANGTSNHVHLLFVLPATQSLAYAIQKLKGSSSRFMGNRFSWQQGYGAFSVSPSHIPIVKKYIQNQKQHHRKQNFEDEFTTLLRNCGVAYDERYVFG